MEIGRSLTSIFLFSFFHFPVATIGGGHVKARVLSSRVMFSGPVFGVRRDRVIEPGGIEVTRDIVTHRGSVVVLPVFPNGDVLMIRQYRHSARRFLWELVAGRIEGGESAVTAARRELLEETGYTARRFIRLFKAYPTPGFVSEVMLLYAAEGLTSGPPQQEADERIQSRRFTAKQIERMMRRGTLCDSKSIAGILYYARFVRSPR
jgi:ADP-ribose pyrophosphatase